MKKIINEKFILKINELQNVKIKSSSNAKDAFKFIKDNKQLVTGGTFQVHAHKTNHFGRMISREEIKKLMKKLFGKPTFPNGYEQYSNWEYWFKINDSLIITLRDHKTNQTDGWVGEYICDVKYKQLAQTAGLSLKQILGRYLKK